MGVVEVARLLAGTLASPATRQNIMVRALERIQRKCSGYFAVWTRDLRRLARYTFVRLALALCVNLDLSVGVPGTIRNYSSLNP